MEWLFEGEFEGWWSNSIVWTIWGQSCCEWKKHWFKRASGFKSSKHEKNNLTVSGEQLVEVGRRTPVTYPKQNFYRTEMQLSDFLLSFSWRDVCSIKAHLIMMILNSDHNDYVTKKSRQNFGNHVHSDHLCVRDLNLPSRGLFWKMPFTDPSGVVYMREKWKK